MITTMATTARVTAATIPALHLDLAESAHAKDASGAIRGVRARRDRSDHWIE